MARCGFIVTNGGDTLRTCPICKNSKFDNGTLVTTSAFSAGALTGLDVLHRSSKKGKIRIYSSACSNCGHIELYLDPKDL